MIVHMIDIIMGLIRYNINQIFIWRYTTKRGRGVVSDEWDACLMLTNVDP